ncbi:MAG: KilA-N domain-containing protein, partial [Rikenellaceae bacterium]
MKTEIFNYNENPVTFKLENGEVMVSATEMAKPFGKKANDWLRLKQTKEYLTALTASGIPDACELVRVKNGDEGGTMMHEDVALEFARWLSPQFAIWCNSKIKELLKTGVATISDDDEVIARAIKVLQERYDQKLIENQK